MAVYPLDWRLSRAKLLGVAFELVRGILGVPVSVSSAYRTPDYNVAVDGAEGSLHLQGLALDLLVPSGATPSSWHQSIVALAQSQAGHLIRGIGYAPPSYDGGFVHVDCRQTVSLAQWSYPR